MFSCNPHAVPSFSFPNQGASNVTDSGSIVSAALITFRHNVGLSGARSAQESWTLTPVTDPEKLRLMRCAYQRAVGWQVSGDCTECCRRQEQWAGRAGTKRLKVVDPETGMLIADASGSPLVDPVFGNAYVAWDPAGLIVSEDPESPKPYVFDPATGLLTVEGRKIQVYDPQKKSLNIDTETKMPFVDPLTGKYYVQWNHEGTQLVINNDPRSITKYKFDPVNNEVWVNGEWVSVFEPRTQNPARDAYGKPYVRYRAVVQTDPRTGYPYIYDPETGEVTVAKPDCECDGPCLERGWFCSAKRLWDVPRECRNATGCFAGTFVWVPRENRDQLSALVLTILGYATKDPPARLTKDVTLYLDEDGNLTTSANSKVQVRGTIPIDADERVLTSLRSKIASLATTLVKLEARKRLRGAERREFDLALVQQLHLLPRVAAAASKELRPHVHNMWSARADVTDEDQQAVQAVASTVLDTHEQEVKQQLSN
jgi:hypothetical protein